MSDSDSGRVLVCQKCNDVRGALSSVTGRNYICEDHGWVEAIEMVPADDYDGLVSALEDIAAVELAFDDNLATDALALQVKAREALANYGGQS